MREAIKIIVGLMIGIVSSAVLAAAPNDCTLATQLANGWRSVEDLSSSELYEAFQCLDQPVDVVVNTPIQLNPCIDYLIPAKATLFEQWIPRPLTLIQNSDGVLQYDVQASGHLLGLDASDIPGESYFEDWQDFVYYLAYHNYHQRFYELAEDAEELFDITTIRGHEVDMIDPDDSDTIQVSASVEDLKGTDSKHPSGMSIVGFYDELFIDCPYDPTPDSPFITMDEMLDQLGEAEKTSHYADYAQTLDSVGVAAMYLPHLDAVKTLFRGIYDEDLNRSKNGAFPKVTYDFQGTTYYIRDSVIASTVATFQDFVTGVIQEENAAIVTPCQGNDWKDCGRFSNMIATVRAVAGMAQFPSSFLNPDSNDTAAMIRDGIVAGIGLYETVYGRFTQVNENGTTWVDDLEVFFEEFFPPEDTQDTAEAPAQAVRVASGLVPEATSLLHCPIISEEGYMTEMLRPEAIALSDTLEEIASTREAYGGENPLTFWADSLIYPQAGQNDQVPTDASGEAISYYDVTKQFLLDVFHIEEPLVRSWLPYGLRDGFFTADNLKTASTVLASGAEPGKPTIWAAIDAIVAAFEVEGYSGMFQCTDSAARADTNDDSLDCIDDAGEPKACQNWVEEFLDMDYPLKDGMDMYQGIRYQFESVIPTQCSGADATMQCYLETFEPTLKNCGNTQIDTEDLEDLCESLWDYCKDAPESGLVGWFSDEYLYGIKATATHPSFEKAFNMANQLGRYLFIDHAKQALIDGYDSIYNTLYAFLEKFPKKISDELEIDVPLVGEETESDEEFDYQVFFDEFATSTLPDMVEYLLNTAYPPLNPGVLPVLNADISTTQYGVEALISKAPGKWIVPLEIFFPVIDRLLYPHFYPQLANYDRVLHRVSELVVDCAHSLNKGIYELSKVGDFAALFNRTMPALVAEVETEILPPVAVAEEPTETTDESLLETIDEIGRMVSDDEEMQFYYELMQVASDPGLFHHLLRQEGVIDGKVQALKTPLTWTQGFLQGKLLSYVENMVQTAFDSVIFYHYNIEDRPMRRVKHINSQWMDTSEESGW